MRETLRKIALVVLICVFITTAFLLIKSLVLEPIQMNKNVTKIQTIYHKIAPINQTPTVQEDIFTFDELQKINSDIVGWITVPNTTIDYPVLQSSEEEPDFYLKKDYRKNNSKYGSIFLNADCSLQNSMNFILYGHSMKDGGMFEPLIKLNSSNCKGSAVITFNTTDEQAKWKVISILKTNTQENQGTVFNYLRTEFTSDADYLNYIYKLRIRSTVNMPVDFEASDKIVTLSTCSYEFSGFRTVVVARKVREGEDDKVDTNQIIKNNSVFYPDCWYEKYGTQKPDWPSTYKEAIDKGLIDWLK